jgi:putative SOS response-associated peptidase YedK
MPLIVPKSHWDGWLDPDREDVTDLLVPTPDDIVSALELRPISSLVNNVRNNGPELLERVDPRQQLEDEGALFDVPKS